MKKYVLFLIILLTNFSCKTTQQKYNVPALDKPIRPTLKEITSIENALITSAENIQLLMVYIYELEEYTDRQERYYLEILEIIQKD